MNLSRIKLALIASGILLVGYLLGAIAQQRVTVTLGGITSETNIVEANPALDRNEPARAESLAFEAIPEDPESYLPYQTLGEVFSRRNETEAAISAYSRAIEKLTGQRGHYRLLQLDASMRRTELMLLRDKITKLRNKT